MKREGAGKAPSQPSNPVSPARALKDARDARAVMTGNERRIDERTVAACLVVSLRLVPFDIANTQLAVLRAATLTGAHPVRLFSRGTSVPR